MRKMLRLTSVGLFLALSAFMLWFGCVYASVTDMLWFHGAAVPAALHSQFLPLYLALMNLIGGSSIAVGLVAAYVTLVPLRNGARWAGTALLVAFVFVFVVAAVTAEELAAATGAPTSWHIMGVLLVVALAGFAAHAVAQRTRFSRTRSVAQ